MRDSMRGHLGLTMDVGRSTRMKSARMNDTVILYHSVYTPVFQLLRISIIYVLLITSIHYHHQVRLASEGRRVVDAPRCPRSTAQHCVKITLTFFSDVFCV